MIKKYILCDNLSIYPTNKKVINELKKILIKSKEHFCAISLFCFSGYACNLAFTGTEI